MLPWPSLASHCHWLDTHATDLLAFGRQTAAPSGGALWLDSAGEPDPSKPIFTWITARMVHVYGLGALMGIPGCRPVAERALAGLTGALRDPDHGGWFPATPPADGPQEKSCYDHVFVLLAAATGMEAGLPGATELLRDATDVFLAKFWDDNAGMCNDVWNPAFNVLDDYRGMNANMHGVEAMLAVASATGEHAWVQRSQRVCEFVARIAEEHDWRLPEHYNAAWLPDLEYNRDQPGHQFKPYGATVGHAFEWSRLFLHHAAAPGAQNVALLASAAVQLFDRAVADGWARDGHPGFVYTTDFSGKPVVRDRMHWVLAEAINTAAVLHRRTGDARYATLYADWWDHAEQFHLDHELGSWIAQLDPENRPGASIWAGKPDIYHAFQTTLVPRLPAYPMMATAVRMGMLPD